MQTLQILTKFLLTPLVAALTFAGYNVNQPIVLPTPPPQIIYQQMPAPVTPKLGATNAIEAPIALFSTSLATGISSSDTTMTLVSATTLDGTTLSSSTYGFVIDEGTAIQEFVRADCTATACRNLERGISAITGTTSVAALAHAHRRGATVKITDAPILINLTRIISGIGSVPAPIRYTSSVASTSFVTSYDIVDKDYVDGAAFSGAGVIDATNAARGVSTLATSLQAASSTATLSAHPLVIPSSISTSTYNSATAGLKVVVTQNNGKIDSNFISTTTLFSNIVLTGTTTAAATSSVSVGAFPVWQIGKQVQVYSTAGTSTFIKPSGISVIYVKMVAGGGGGGNSAAAANSGAGGGAGGYSEGPVDISSLSSVQVVVGAGGAGGNPGGGGGISMLGISGNLMSTIGGGGGALGASSGGFGGSAGTGGAFNSSGGQGQAGFTGSATANTCQSLGGSSAFGGASAYGSGGCGGNNSGTGASGSTGFVIISW